MPKYYDVKVAGCCLYFTSHCTFEAMHVHANEDGTLSRSKAAKFWVGENGESKVAKQHTLSAKQVRIIQAFIKNNYMEMYQFWKKHGGQGFYRNI